MRLPFKEWEWQEIVEYLVVFSVANFIGITLFAGMVFCILECSIPIGKKP